jgi:hypothetical protein
MNKLKLTLLLFGCIQLTGCGGDSGGGDVLLLGGALYAIAETINSSEETTDTSSSSSSSGTSSGGGSYDWSYSCGYSGSGSTVPIPIGACETEYKNYAQVWGCNDVANFNSTACDLQNCTGQNMGCGAY